MVDLDGRGPLGAGDVEADDLAAIDLAERTLLGIGVGPLPVRMLDRSAAADGDLVSPKARALAALPRTRTDCSEPAISARPPAAFTLTRRSC